MFTVRKRIFIALVLTVSLVPVALGQQAQSVTQADAPPHQQTKPTPKADATTTTVREYVEEKGFKGQVFDVKYRDTSALVRAITPLGSGFKGAIIRFEDSFKTITVRDFPENIAAIEEALKRLDVPQSPQPDIDLRIHILIASNIEGAANQYPADLGDVVKQMQAMLNYKNYYLVTSIVQRVKDGTHSINGKGNAQLQAPLVQATSDLQYEYNINGLSTTSTPSGGVVTELNYLGFRISGHPKDVGSASINTSLNARDGEKVVVGTASLKDKALILVLRANVMK